MHKNDKVSDYVLILEKFDEKYHLNFFIDDFYFERETSETFINYRNSLLKLILDVLKKYNNRLMSINSKLEECNDMDKYKYTLNEGTTLKEYTSPKINNDYIDSEKL